MPVNFHFADISFRLKNSLFLKKWVRGVVKLYKKKSGDINFILCSDDFLLELNRKHLKHDTFTDILTFDLSENTEIVSGDIFISVERVRENAKKFSVNFDDELHRVMIHGILHLLGFSDKTKMQKRQMREAEDACLQQLKLNL